MTTRRIALMKPSQMFDTFLDDFFNVPSSLGFGGNANLNIDLFEDENNVTVKANVPGIKSDNLNISIEDNILTISYEQKEEQEEEDKKKKYYYKEIRQESFTRSINLPSRVDGDRADASFEDGVLTIVMPKLEEVKPKRVEIRTNKK